MSRRGELEFSIWVDSLAKIRPPAYERVSCYVPCYDSDPIKKPKVKLPQNKVEVCLTDLLDREGERTFFLKLNYPWGIPVHEKRICVYGCSSQACVYYSPNGKITSYPSDTFYHLGRNNYRVSSDRKTPFKETIKSLVRLIIASKGRKKMNYGELISDLRKAEENFSEEKYSLSYANPDLEAKLKMLEPTS